MLTGKMIRRLAKMADFSDVSYRQGDRHVSDPPISMRFIIHDWRPTAFGYRCSRCKAFCSSPTLVFDSTSPVEKVDCLTALVEDVMES